MNTQILKRKGFVFIFTTVLIVAFGIQDMSYAQEADPTITAAVQQPLTEATLPGSVVTLTLSDGIYERFTFRIRNALTFSGIDGVTVRSSSDVARVSDTEVTVELTFAGDFDTDATLAIEVGARAIADYDGDALTAQLPVTAVEESLDVSTEFPLTEANLHGSIITLTLTGRRFTGSSWDIEDALTVSGIEGVTVRSSSDVARVSDTEVIVELTFAGNIDTDTPLIITVEAVALANYNGSALTSQIPVTAIEESLTATTEAPLTEATLDGSIVTLKLSGRRFLDSWDRDIRRALSFSGIEGVTVSNSWDVVHVSDTEVTVELTFSGNINTDATLTLTVGAAAINHNEDFTFNFPVTAVEESLTATTEAPLTEADLQGGTITLTLSGRRFAGRRFAADDWNPLRNALTLSGIEGTTVSEYNVFLLSDTKAAFTLVFSGNIDTDATLTLTVGEDAIVGYNKDFTFNFPVTAVEESMTATTEAPLTEANLNVNVIKLSVSGRRFISYHRVTISGIEGATVDYVDRVSDTEAAVNLRFSGDFDKDATLTLTVGAEAIGYSEDFTFNFPVTAVEQSDATVSISPSPITLPGIGEKLTLNLNIANGKNIAGYQATVSFDRSVLRNVEGNNGNYLPADTFFKVSIHSYNRAVITGNTLAGVSNGDGTLATLTFDVFDYRPSTVTLSDVYLVDADGKRWEVTTENGEILEPPKSIFGDLNHDGVVNIQDLVIVSNRFGVREEHAADVNEDGIVDIVDLVLVADAFGADAAAPSLNPQVLEQLTAADVKGWLTQAQKIRLTDPDYKRGITVLEQLHKALTPKATVLLPNFPNPFNPETWIPYHLAKDAKVTLHIYAMNGTLVRTLALGHQAAGMYQNRSRAAYWDGKNEFGEKVATGVYFYTLTAGEYSATRKMYIRK